VLPFRPAVSLLFQLGLPISFMVLTRQKSGAVTAKTDFLKSILLLSPFGLISINNSPNGDVLNKFSTISTVSVFFL